MKNKFLTITSVFIFLITIAGCSSNNNSNMDNSIASTTTETTAVTTTMPPVPEPDPVVRVVAVGDNLIHSSIYNQAKARATDGGYDFDFTYQHIEDMISPADLAILNQETPIANDKFEPSTYPMFNSPTQLGDKMIDLGFNAISHCNNHILDKGEAGLIATLDYWKSRNMLVYGAYRDNADLNNIKTMDINGIKFAFVGFMEHTNGLRLPKDATAKLVYLSDLETVENQIKKANELADVVVVSVHWGVEITNEITQQQKDLAKKFVEWGTDVIIGTQPHAVQSMEYLDKPDGGKAFVTYSLGNFISAQSYNISMIGLVMDFNVTKNLKTNMITISDVKAIPVITHYDSNYANVTVYPYNQYSEDLAKVHGIHKDGKFSMLMIDTILKDNVPEEFLYLK